MAAYAALACLAQTTDLNRNQDEHVFSINAEEKIRSIHEYVIFLVSFLDDFPAKANRWEGEMRDVAHKTEDIIKDLMRQQMKSSYIPMNPSSVKLEDQLKDVTVKIGLIAGEMMEERPAYLPAAVSSPLIAGNDAVIGLDDDLMAIKERLCGQSSHLQVIPIVGMGGIGKTTLATTVYDDPLILEYFEIRAWLIVSQDYSPHSFRKLLLGLIDSMKLLKKCDESEDEEEVYKNLKKQLSRDQIDESEMTTKVYRNLKGRRYLIVMDDVWRTDVLDDVRNVFPDDSNGSRIMLTTRLSNVAAYPDFSSPLHGMRFMDDYQSWDFVGFQ